MILGEYTHRTSQGWHTVQLHTTPDGCCWDCGCAVSHCANPATPPVFSFVCSCCDGTCGHIGDSAAPCLMPACVVSRVAEALCR